MAFLFLYMTLDVDKLNGHGLSNTARHEHLPKKTKVTQYQLQKDYQTVPTSWNISIVKGSGHVQNDAFKRLGFSFTVIILT